MTIKTILTASLIVSVITGGSAVAQSSVGAQAGGNVSAGNGANMSAGVGASSHAGLGGVLGGTVGTVQSAAHQTIGTVRMLPMQLSSTAVTKARATTTALARLQARERTNIFATGKSVVNAHTIMVRNRIIAQHGLTVQEYDHVIALARTNPSLANRIGLKSTNALALQAR